MTSDRVQTILPYLSGLAKDAFYGTVALRFDAGRIVLVNVQQALKPETIYKLTSPEETKLRSINERTLSKQ
jgi:hypothetical protein